MACWAAWACRWRTESTARTAAAVAGGVCPAIRWALLMAETRRRRVALDRSGSKSRNRAAVSAEAVSAEAVSATWLKAAHQSVNSRQSPR